MQKRIEAEGSLSSQKMSQELEWYSNPFLQAVREASHPVHTPGSCEDWKVPAHCSISSRM